jgi:hypothetical protein
MVQLTRIYTKGGDKGETSLGDGARVKKHSLRVDAYGTVDEANAAIGLARLHATGAATISSISAPISAPRKADGTAKARCASCRRRPNGWSTRSTR